MLKDIQILKFKKEKFLILLKNDTKLTENNKFKINL
jgi:hypothetical protein